MTGKKSYGGTAGGSRPPRDVIYTPDWLADKICQLAKLEPWMSILDPAAGTDRQPLMDAVSRSWGNHHPRLLMGYEIGLGSDVVTRLDGGHVVGQDFLALQKPATLEAFDRIIMNPPFSKLGAWKFILHAMDWLKPNGQIFAIVPAYILTQNIDRNLWFNKHLTGHWRMPTNSFAPAVKLLQGFVIRVERYPTADNLGFLYPGEQTEQTEIFG